MRLSSLDEKSIALRASDKLEAQLFFSYKKLEELELINSGVIHSDIDEDVILGQMESQKRDIDVLTYMFELVEKSY